ncbi:hypothetical protein [Sorangium cellulosum]|uniref:hypothetical protein n=1 Tax=Sorangium cellulosum TaxID=56 RepID=UPI000A76E323|nr:hypothetical protein [Sorangium cellulosum]
MPSSRPVIAPVICAVAHLPWWVGRNLCGACDEQLVLEGELVMSLREGREIVIAPGSGSGRASSGPRPGSQP